MREGEHVDLWILNADCVVSDLVTVCGTSIEGLSATPLTCSTL